MPLDFKDRVKDQTNTTGTGTVTIDGVAPIGYRTITSAHPTGSTLRYTIINGSGSEWEVGEGIWTSSNNTLTRATVYSSSNSGALVNFGAGAKAVFTGPVAADRNGQIDTNLTFLGTGLRIVADFTNATVASRMLFQTSTANSSTFVGVIPSGTATNAQVQVMNSSAPDNSSFGALIVNANQVRLTSAAVGTGTQLPLAFFIGTTEAARFSTAFNLLLGTTTDNTTDRLQVSGSMSLSSALRVGASPSAGTSGQVLTSAGSGAAPTWSSVNGIPPITVVTGTTQAAVAGNHYVLTNAAASTATLPSAPSAGDLVWVTAGNGRLDNVVARNGQNIMDLAEDMTINNRHATVQLRFVNSTLGWRIV